MILTFSCLFTTVGALNAQNLQELQRLQDEYKKALERQSLNKPVDISEAEKAANSTSLPDKLIYSRKDVESLLANTEKLLKQLDFYEDSIKKMPYIGYDFFTKRDSIPFWQNLPMSGDYILGAGDEIIISLWGESNSNYSEIINRDGEIFIENIGIVNLGGKSINETKDYIKIKFSRQYSTLLGSNPKSFIDITLGELKSLNIQFTGFVNIPGTHMVHPFSNVVTGLIQAGGVDIKGSLRQIKVIRNNKISGVVDIYDLIINAEKLKNLRLMDQDVVHVPPRNTTIPISGRILRPGYYELNDDENIEDLISFSGGKDRNSSNFVFIFKNHLSNNEGYIVQDSLSQKFKINNGDSVHVPISPGKDSFVSVEGKVKVPGKYPYNSNIRLEDIIKATMSLNDKDFILNMNLSEIVIFRKNRNGSQPIKIKTGLEDNILLQNGDHIVVSEKNIFRPIEAVKITGEIKRPGSYPVNGISTLEDIIILSGGLTENALKDGIEVFRDSITISWNDKDFILENGDSLNVLKRSGLVFVDGEVNNPGYLSFRKGDNLKKYIRRAGGFTPFAEENNVYIIHPNGTAYPFSKFNNPKVLEGSKIIIGQRTISGHQKLTGWEIFSSISAQAGNIATTLLSISLLLNQANAN